MKALAKLSISFVSTTSTQCSSQVKGYFRFCKASRRHLHLRVRSRAYNCVPRQSVRSGRRRGAYHSPENAQCEANAVVLRNSKIGALKLFVKDLLDSSDEPLSLLPTETALMVGTLHLCMQDFKTATDLIDSMSRVRKVKVTISEVGQEFWHASVRAKAAVRLLPGPEPNQTFLNMKPRPTPARTCNIKRFPKSAYKLCDAHIGMKGPPLGVA